MAAVNWDGTEKVTDTRAVTLSNLSDDVIQNLMSFENNNVHSPNEPEYLNFQKLQPFIPKYPLNHQYLLQTSYIKMIETICSIH